VCTRTDWQRQASGHTGDSACMDAAKKYNAALKCPNQRSRCCSAFRVQQGDDQVT
jgi:hypothetical protein